MKPLTADSIKETYYGYFERQAKVSPCLSNRASRIGYPCDRALVLDRTKWQDKGLPPLKRQLVFNEGRKQEQAVIRDLQEAGFEIQEAQKALGWPEYQLTAHFDFRLSLNGGPPVLCEVKSMSPYVWQGVESYKDMAESRFFWVRGYLAQMQIYLLLEAKDEHGFFILKNKSTGEISVIQVDLDYDFAESLIQKCERINAHVANNTLPDHLNDIDICEGCDHFGRTCDPSLSFGEGASIIDDPEFIALLEQREALKAPHKEYEQIHKVAKRRLAKVAQAIAGEFIIAGKENKNGAWLTKIVKMDKGKDQPPSG